MGDAKIPISDDVYIRLVLPTDYDSLADICLKTADSGNDGTHLFKIARIVGERWILPYAILQPELCVVLVDKSKGERVVGYACAALDTGAFEKKVEETYFPFMRLQYPLSMVTEGKVRLLPDDVSAVKGFHTPELAPAAVKKSYPSHLHIDIYGEYHGRRYGDRLLHALFALLREKGSVGVHLGMSSKNAKARRFYDRLGFKFLGGDDSGWMLGMRFTEADSKI